MSLLRDSKLKRNQILQRMKTNELIEHLDAIDKNNLIVRILTESKSFSKTQHPFTSATGCQFFIEVDLQFADFGNNPEKDFSIDAQNEFAIQSKKVELIFIKVPEGRPTELTNSQKLIVEDFFKNFFIPDLYLVRPYKETY